MSIKSKNHGGIVPIRLEPGEFYYCPGVGSFSDPSNGFEIPGCRAEIDEVSRRIIRLELPQQPVQMPHLKRVPNPKDVSEYIEMPFTDWDTHATGEALQMAANTGIIRRATDQEMHDIWPEALAKKSPKLVFDRREVLAASNIAMADMLEQAKVARTNELREGEAEAAKAAKR